MIRDRPLISFCIVTHDRQDDSVEAINSALAQEYPNKEVVVVASIPGNTHKFLSERYQDDDRVTVYEERKRRGPPAARNEVFERANGDIYVIIDDDAVLHGTDSARKIVRAFESDPAVGGLCFKSVDYDSRVPIPIELPKGPNGKCPDERYFTTYFIGVGAAFRADVIDQVEGFPEEFFYYMEELDLSFQILDAGYTFLYTPEIVVRHKGSDGSRPNEDDQWRLALENRIRVAIRHLPWRYIVTSSVIWTIYVIYRTGLSYRTVVTAYRNIISDWSDLSEQRDPISPETCRRIAELNGRLWY